MTRALRIFIPTWECKKNEIIYFKGHISISEQFGTVVYITQFSTESIKIKDQDKQSDSIYGYVCKNFNKGLNITSQNRLIIEKGLSIRIRSLVLGNKVVNASNCIFILYEHSKLKNSESIGNSDDYFSCLQLLLRENEGEKVNYEPMLGGPELLSSSMFAQHILNYFNLLFWLITTVTTSKKVSVKSGNLILAILIDVTLGYILLEFLKEDNKKLSAMLMGVLEELLNMLYSLLKWVMGAPAGLKLNNAFNKMLGKYFSYHIQLWSLFLDVSGEKLDTILYIYHYVGYLGITYQAAIISDLLSLATFHSYCIYVYAARYIHTYLFRCSMPLVIYLCCHVLY